MMVCFAPKIGRPCEQSILPVKKRTRSQFPLCFLTFLFDLNMFSAKQGKMGLASVHLIMYEHSVLIDQIEDLLTLIS